MIWAVHLVFMEVEANILANNVIAMFTHEAVQVELFVKCLEYLTINLPGTFSANFGEQEFKVFLAVRLIIVLAELVPRERLATLGAYKVIRVPGLVQRADVLTFNNFLAVATLGVKGCVVIILAVELPIFFNKGFSSKKLITAYTPKMVRMKSFVLGYHEGSIYGLSTRMAHFGVTA
jgi:hypothetical protein